MNATRRRLCTDAEIRSNQICRKPFTDDLGKYNGDCKFPPLPLVVSTLLAIVLIVSCIAVIAQ